MKDILLGKKTPLPPRRAPEILCPLPRRRTAPESFGFDCWRDYELTWLDRKGKPQVAILEITYPAATAFIIESKSMKLYLGSLANEPFADTTSLINTISKDLGQALQTEQIEIRLFSVTEPARDCWPDIEAINIDGLDIQTATYRPDPQLLQTYPDICHERLRSDLLMSFCPITHQPDWGSVIIEYRGPRLDHSALLKYIISYRQHEGFAESCCEAIYTDIMTRCRPEELTVTCLYTRRGGIDINPARSSHEISGQSVPRTSRQ